MGQDSAHGSTYGSAPGEDDGSPVEEMSPVKAKKPSTCASKAKKNDTRRRSRQKTGQRRKRSRCAKLGAMCRKIVRKETNHESGSRDPNVYQKACAKYELMYRHDFTLEACWNILKDHQGWLKVEMPFFYHNTKGRKKSKTSETTSGSAPGGFNMNVEADEFEE
nr:hypothetical protein [Tanacetum cinerariifolium]